MITAAALSERPGHPREALSALSDGAEAVVSAPWWRCGDEEVAGAVADMERQAARLDAARRRLLTEADQRGIVAASWRPSRGLACTRPWTPSPRRAAPTPGPATADRRASAAPRP